MMADPRQDEQDREFGAAAAEDQETVEQLSDRGFDEEEMPEGPKRDPRPAGKAKPAGE